MTADNDDDAADPGSATFRTAPAGRAPFRFTSFGDLGTPNTEWVLSYGQSAYAVEAVESFQPLFHLLNGDLCYANLNPACQPQVWRDFGDNNQASAANRSWMPCLGNHEVEFGNGPQGFTSYLTRYTLPDNAVPGFGGRWYRLRIGSVLFVSLDADDVVYQDAGAFVAGPDPLTPAADTGNPLIGPGTSLYVRGYSGGAQTAWLEETLRAGRGDQSVDWIVIQMHQCAVSSSARGNGCDLGIRRDWLPLEEATWSARRDTETGYGIAVFDVEPGTEAGGQTSITARYYHAVGADSVNPATGAKGGPTPDYTEFETFTLVRPRRRA